MPITEEGLRNWAFDPIPFRVTERDAIIYGLSLGVGSDPLDRQQLRHVYERSLVVFPTMPAVLGSPGMWFGKAGLDARKVLHGSQSIELINSVPLDTPLVARNEITDLIDRGPKRGALVEVTRWIDREDGERIARLISTYVCLGDGGFSGGQSQHRHMAPRRPDRRPDVTQSVPTLPQAALIYRLNGDTNPLHADPEAAAQAGFERPILHGLCSFGHCARAIIAAFGAGRAERLRTLSAKMSRPVFPGETLEVAMWREGEAVFFEAGVAGRDAIVLTRGRAWLREAS